MLIFSQQSFSMLLLIWITTFEIKNIFPCFEKSPDNQYHSTLDSSVFNDICKSWIPYRTKIRRTKVSKFWLGVKNFVRRKIFSVEIFFQYFNTKVRQKSDKSVEIWAWCRKFCPTKFCSIGYVVARRVLVKPSLEWGSWESKSLSHFKRSTQNRLTGNFGFL